MNKQEENKCYDPKRSNGRCISYNRMVEDYERDLLRLKKYKQALEDVRDKFNCFRSCMIPFHIGYSEELPHRMANQIQEHCIEIENKINEVLKDE